MPSNQERFIAMVNGTPDITPTALSRLMGVDRSYIYQLARKSGYTRVNNTWASAGEVDQQGDLLFQYVTEMREMLERMVSGDVVTTSDGVSHPPGTPASVPAPEPVTVQPWTNDSVSHTITVPYTARPGDPLRLDEIVRDVQRWENMNKSTAGQTVTALLNALVLTYYPNLLKSNN